VIAVVGVEIEGGGEVGGMMMRMFGLCFGWGDEAVSNGNRMPWRQDVQI